MRLELSRRTDIGLRALRHLAAAGTDATLSRTELAEAIHTTPGFLPQAIMPLVKRGWIDSRPGTKGGYSLARNPAEITILELIEAVEGPIDDGPCVLGDPDCPDIEPCALHAPWGRARDALRAELAATCVADCTEPSHPEGGGND